MPLLMRRFGTMIVPRSATRTKEVRRPLAIDTVTFDFHNTLAWCDEWFQLEIRTLVPELLRWHGAGGDAAAEQAAVELYRGLRLEIIHHGNEQDVVSCAMQVLGELEIDVDRPTVERGIAELMRGALATSEPVVGAVDAVLQLAESGLRLGIISNAIYHPFLEWSLEKFGLADAFSVVVTSASAGYYKTRPELYHHTLERLGSDPDRSVHVGDSYRFDVLGARAIGMGTVWFDTGHDEGAGDDADLVVTTLEGLAPLLLDRFRNGQR